MQFFNLIYLFLTKYSWVISLISLAGLTAGFYLKNGDLKEISGCTLFISVCSTLTYYMECREKRLRKKYDSFASKLINRLNSGKYFNSSSWQNSYREYCSRYQHHRISAGRIMKDLSKRFFKSSFRPILVRVAVGIGVVFYVLQIFADALSLVPFSFAEIIGVTIASALLLYISVLYIISRWKSKRWLHSCEKKGIELRSLESSYFEGTAFECYYNCVVLGSCYVHGFNGKYFFTVPRDQIRAVSWYVKRFKIFTLNNLKLITRVYMGDEYRFYVVFSCCDGMEYKVALDQFQIKLIMDRYFSSETSNSAGIGYSVTSVYGLDFSSLKKYTSPVMMSG